MRPVRCFFDMLMRYRSGLSLAMCVQTAWAKALASFQPRSLPSLTFSGVTTCRPLPPVVLQKDDEAELFEPVAHFLGRGDDG